MPVPILNLDVTGMNVQKRKLDEIFEFFVEEPMALFSEFFERLYNEQGYSVAELRGFVDDSLSYLEECDFVITNDAEEQRILAQESSRVDEKRNPLVSEFAKFTNYKPDQRLPSFSAIAGTRPAVDVFDAWAQLLSSELEKDIPTEHLNTFVENMCRWMVDIIDRDDWLVADEASIARIRIFSNAKAILARDDLSQQAQGYGYELLSYQPTQDMVPLLLASTRSWLARRRFRMVLSAPVSEHYKVWRVIDVLPFTEPDPLDIDRLQSRIADTYTRTDIYLMLIKRLYLLIFPNHSVADKTRKVTWWLPFLQRMIRSHPPAWRLIDTLSTNVDTILRQCEREREKSGIASPYWKDLVNLKALLRSGTASSTVDAIDLFSFVPKDSLVSTTIKPADHVPDPEMVPDPTANFNTHRPQQSEVATTAAIEDVVTTLSKPRTEVFEYLPTDTTNKVLCLVDDIWFQLDPNIRRMVGVGSTDPGVDEEVMTARVPGVLRIMRAEIVWTPLVTLMTDERVEDFDAQLVVRYPEVTQWTFGTIHPSQLEPDTALVGAQEVAGSVANFGHNGEPCYVSLFTEDSVFRLFPFHTEEAQGIVDLLTQLSGQPPFTEKAFVTLQMDRNIGRRRIEVNQTLAMYRAPWITHTKDLSSVLQNLTSGQRHQEMSDMERLYHSCRLNESVTKETITQLRRLWRKAQTEPARLKILSIANRLLDRSILRQGDQTFDAFTVWLGSLEGSLDPYKSPQSVRIVHELLKQATRLRSQLMAPISAGEFGELFDDVEEFGKTLDWAELVALDDEAKKAAKMVAGQSRGTSFRNTKLQRIVGRKRLNSLASALGMKGNKGQQSMMGQPGESIVGGSMLASVRR
ncbi:hypothetical protein J8273_6408 [Carpediemonas membranifera]|uniref:Uncharacterized protein n=1 Tax=Carpediemonas membranifera TaxID=201153 RepID=A0A8J6E044_9EUKA|nr:hypothetical protein J8273_6408 [Carpediemonas membranifera]|eukprot:KAG9391643.1 hypothetical protein J8273_6408 [Carpediemonas membranifera]